MSDFYAGKNKGGDNKRRGGITLFRIATHEGDGPLTNEVLRQLHGHLDNAHFWNRQMLYDLFADSFYSHIGITDMVPSWLALGEKEQAPYIRIPARELIVGVRYYFARGKYKQALAILCKFHDYLLHNVAYRDGQKF